MRTAGKWIRISILSGLIIGILLFVFFFGKRLVQAMLPLGLGVVIAYIELPIVESADKLKISRTMSIILSFLISFLIIIVTLLCVVPLLVDNIKGLTSFIPGVFNTLLNYVLSFIETNVPSVWQQDILHELDNNFMKLQSVIMEEIYNFISNIPRKISFIFDVMVGWILSFYILRDKEQIKEGIKHFFPTICRDDMVCFFRDIHRVVLRFIQGQMLIAVIIAAIETTGLYFIGMQYALILGFIGGISNIIPYFGPYIGAIPALAVALTISPWKAFWTAVVFVIAQQIDNIILSPRIMKGKLGLHPVTTIMAVIAGGRLFGILGMMFSVPLVAMLKILFKRIFKIVSG
jgi:predicted PurR-regulated permease PerM